MGMENFFESIAPGLAAGGSAVLGHQMAQDLKDTGAAAQEQMGALAGQLKEDTQFHGYGVQTGLGSSTVGADGSTNLGVGPDAGLMAGADALLGQAQNGFGAAADAAAGLQGNGQLGAAVNGLNAASDLAGQNSSNALLGQATGLMEGSLQGVAGQQAGSFDASQQAMQNAMQGTAGREQEIYDRTMAMQQPGLDAAQAQQQAREHAMGRGGVRGSQFGGTAEDAAMAKAQANAMNQASFQAMGQAQQEMMNQASMSNMFGQMGFQGQQAQAGVGQGIGALGNQNAQLGQGAAALQGQFANQQGQLGAQQAQLEAQRAQMMASIAGQQGALGMQQNQAAYTPMQQQLAAMQVAQGNAGMAQSGQMTGAGYGAQLGMGGIQADINSQKAASELYGNMFDSIMSNAGTIGAGMDGLWNKIFD